MLLKMYPNIQRLCVHVLLVGIITIAAYYHINYIIADLTYPSGPRINMDQLSMPLL